MVIPIGFIAMSACYVYYFNFRVIWRVELTPTELRWRHVIGGGAAALADVRSIRCVHLGQRRREAAGVRGHGGIHQSRSAEVPCDGSRSGRFPDPRPRDRPARDRGSTRRLGAMPIVSHQ